MLEIILALPKMQLELLNILPNWLLLVGIIYKNVIISLLFAVLLFSSIRFIWKLVEGLFILFFINNYYRCVSSLLLPLVPPKISSFSFGDEAMNSGDTVSVQCTIAGGDLPLEVRWTQNGHPLEPYLEIITQKLGKRINNLIIDSVSAKHAGNYTCIAENTAGIAQYSSELMVIGMQIYCLLCLFTLKNVLPTFNYNYCLSLIRL